MIKSLFNREQAGKLRIPMELFFLMAWICNLSGTDARHSVYALIGILSAICMMENSRRGQKNLFRIPAVAVCAMVFSFLTFLANYPLFQINWFPNNASPLPGYLRNGLNSLCSLVGGFVAAGHILLYGWREFPRQVSRRSGAPFPFRQVFLFTFLSVVLVDLLYLFLDEFPAHIMQDPLGQLQQAFTGQYQNNHPVWHTWFLEAMLSLGFGIFGSANGAAAFLSCFQILVMALCFAYAIAALYQSGMPKWCVLLSFGIYVLSPYNIAYSITFIKDVYFGMAVLLIVTSVYRIFQNPARPGLADQAVLAGSLLLLCLSRTNGFFVCCIFLLFLLAVLFKKNKKLAVLLIAVALLGWFLTGPLLTLLQVESTDVVETLSMPLQQMARVVSQGCPLTPEQQALLEQIWDLESVPQVYVQWLSDPIKAEVRSHNTAYLKAHLSEYWKLWLELGKEYPLVYLEAWVEQTKGYWNGGYNYFQYAEGILQNDFGFYKTAPANVVSLLFELYFAAVNHLVLLQPFNSIGLQVWIIAVCCLFSARSKRPEALLSIPILVIIAGLLLGTPVYAEFRYAYPLFVTCPFILSVTLYRTSPENG